MIAHSPIWQEKVLKEKQKPKEPKEASDTATSGQSSAAADKSDDPITAAPQDVSPFACLSSTMGWETFHMVHVLWIGMVDTAGKPAEKDWELQVCCWTNTSCSYHCYSR